MRTARQLMKVASVNNIPIDGLYMTGQNALAPGVMGSILGSLNVVRKIIGAERFAKDIKW